MKDRLKVVFIIADFDFGGIEKILYDVAHQFKDDKDIDFKIVNISGTGRKYEDLVSKGFDIFTCGSSKDTLKKFNLSTIMCLRKFIKETNPDIVHTTQYKGDYFGRLACIGLDVKVMTHIRNPKVQRKFFRRLSNKMLAPVTDMFVSVSSEVQEMVNSNYNSKDVPSIVLHNFIDLEKVADAQPANKADFGLEDKKIIISVGRLVPEKNVDLLISAMPHILKEVPDAHLVVVGEGGLKDKLIGLSKELGVDENVTLLGYRTDVYSLLKMVDVYAMPSSFEGFSNAHLEAMAAGLPCVVSDNLSTKEFAEPCSIYCKNDAKVIAESISSILTDENKAEKMSQESYRISSNFSVENYIKNFKRVYAELSNL